MHAFCTLFNSKYLTRGILLYESLEEHCKEFALFVFAFDDLTVKILEDRKYANLHIVRLTEFEDDQLLEVKNSRTFKEYCWTCGSSTIYYILNKYPQFKTCTYIDADMYFYSDPTFIFNQINIDTSAIITPHNYTARYDQSTTSGYYCVQWVTIVNNANGLMISNWWRNACIEWCYDRHEDGKFGDQKYLDNWPTQFNGIYELSIPGIGLAPWNAYSNQYQKIGDAIKITDKKTNQVFSLVFFHFHGMKFNDVQIFITASKKYLIDPILREFIFKPYVDKLYKLETNISTQYKDYKMNGIDTLQTIHEIKYRKGNLSFIRCNVIFPIVDFFYRLIK